ncbi:MAG: DUF1285 domain-containing protein [bacterium]
MKPPPADIRIDREGRWFANGKPIVHEKILSLFCQSIVREGDSYMIRIGEESNPVIVEDTPFCVRGLYLENTEEGVDLIRLLLSDGRTICLAPETLRAPDTQSLYCSIPGTDLEARFSREALSQFGRFLEHDAESGDYYLEINGDRFTLDQEN